MGSPCHRCCRCEQTPPGTATACPLHQAQKHPCFLCPSAAIRQGQTARCVGMGLDRSWRLWVHHFMGTHIVLVVQDHYKTSSGVQLGTQLVPGHLQSEMVS